MLKMSKQTRKSELTDRAKRILKSSDEWNDLLDECKEAIERLTEFRKRLIVNKDKLDMLSGDLLEFTDVLDDVGRLRALANYVARGMEFRLKRRKSEVVKDAVDSGKSVTFAKDVLKYTSIDKEFEDFNEAQLLSDTMYSAWELAKDTSQAARSTVSYEKTVYSATG